ncbi:MAG: tRNA pseudouridine(38-40) synthase TruA [Ignavibacteria bacterium]|nr:tRNA pseudouridine(38-40) synthase TruA [Ignavibacteria bacterium]
MTKYKLTIEYDGTRYSGWQAQQYSKTVQGTILKAAEQVFGNLKEIQGAGRTDAGVHALAQIAHLVVAKELPTKKIQFALNDLLPFDINILSVEKVHERFHARHSAISRSYIYQISKRRTAFGKEFVWWIKDELNVKAMQEAAKIFIGMHDFASFADKKLEKGETKCLVESVELAEVDELILFRIRASHFLWKMVRRIVGTLVEVGRGNISKEKIEFYLKKYSNEPAEFTAPPSGLFLEQILYEKEKWNEALVPAIPLSMRR